MNKKVLVAMSGGVDSSAAAIILKEQGYEVAGATMILWDGAPSKNIDDAKMVCDYLKIPHYVFDYSKEFEKTVIQNFLTEYKNGRTPNPCIVCNKFFKFGEFAKKAKELGYEYIATGHYAKTSYNENTRRYELIKSNSEKKDQSYVLYGLTQDALAHIIFPLNDYENKEDIRKIVSKAGLTIAAKPDSQEICFIPNGEYAKFIEERIGKFEEGNIVDSEVKIIGKLEGIINYTIGQRKGIGISSPKPLFVNEIDAKNSTIIVGNEEKIFKNELIAKDTNLITINELKEPKECTAKIRYLAKEAPCTIYPIEKGKVKVVFKEKQRAITPGQAVVFYEENKVIGGGTIE